MSELRILLADDTEGDMLLVRQALEKLQVSYRLKWVVDGEKALVILLKPQEKFDLFLLDLNMPRMDGFELLETLKTTPLEQVPPIFILSGTPDSLRVKELLGGNVLGVVDKDYQLLETLELALKTLQAK